MKWSRYNILYVSKKYGHFLYNSRTNGFVKVDEDTYKLLVSLKNHSSNIDITSLDTDIIEILRRFKAIIDDLEDDNYVIQKKFLKYRENFNTDTLGIIVVPTLSCNFACPYCYEQYQPHTIMDDQTIDQIVEFIKGFSKISEYNLCWHGGEPLLGLPAIYKILERLRINNLKPASHSIITNGYLLDRETCEQFKFYNLTFVQVTIDGMPDTHNKSRLHKAGVPTFDRIISNIETLFDVHPECQVLIRVNIHSENKDDFPALSNYLTARWGNKHKYIISLQYADDRGGCKVGCLKHRERIQYTKEICQKCNMDMADIYPSIQLGGCSADHINTFIIGPLGELYKCWVEVGQQNRVIGHINDPVLDLSKFAEYIVGSDMFNDPKCLQCSLLPICDGGCELYRINYKQNNNSYDICPYSMDDMPLLLDTFYEQHLSKMNDKPQ